MEKLQLLQYLNNYLLSEMQEYKSQAKRFGENISEQHQLLRSLMNLRSSGELPEEFLQVQDQYLQLLKEEKGVVKLEDLMPIKANKNIYIWQGDITRLNVDVIVNAANSQLLGCFIPCHGCIDNAIHSAAGLELRQECQEIMNKQGHSEATGDAKITESYNLPCNYVLHTVGPIISGELREYQCEELAGCYKNCMELAMKQGLKSIAFCCISTGEFHFPNERAAQIAVETVGNILGNTDYKMEVVFNVFKDYDYEIYRELLGEDR